MILLKCKKPYDLDMFQVVLNSVLSMKETTHDCAGANIKNKLNNREIISVVTIEVVIFKYRWQSAPIKTKAPEQKE